MVDAQGGRTFRALLSASTGLPLERGLDLVRGAADALDAFHARGTVHGAVSADALIERVDRRIVLRDPCDLEVISPPTDLAVYLSPQRLSGEPARPSDDLYALGVVAHQLLLGRLPSSAAGGRAFRPADVPPEVERVLLTQLATAPSRRFSSGAELVRELEQACASRKVASDDPAADAILGAPMAGRRTDLTWTWPPSRAGRVRAAPTTRLALAELPDGVRQPIESSGRRVTRRSDYPEVGLPGILVAAIVVLLCSVYLFPLYYMLFRSA
jgi:serine/threonine protein kinase